MAVQLQDLNRMFMQETTALRGSVCAFSRSSRLVGWGGNSCDSITGFLKLC